MSLHTERSHKNAARLKLLYPPLALKVKAILSDMESHSWLPVIDAQVFRTKAEQLKLFERGVTTVKFSFHNVTLRDGTPASLAADIVDERWQWNSTQAYWLMLAASARAHGLETGIHWGLNRADRAAIDNAIAARNWAVPRLRLGWDTAHVQPQNFPLWRAKLHKFPEF